MFSEKDLQQIKNKGITIEEINRQISNFKKGFPFLDIIKPATVGDGIIKLSEKDIEKYAEIYDQIRDSKNIVKFIPASGAASRMFKDLFDFYNNPTADNISTQDEFLQYGYAKLWNFFKELHKYAFYNDLKNCFKNDGKDIDNEINNKNFKVILKYLLTEKGLNYGNLPKALLSFHKYADEIRTPFEEHLVEGIEYASSSNEVKLHFTVSPEHLQFFKNLEQKTKLQYEEKYGLKFTIEYSQQKSSTDTIAVDHNNQPFRESDGSLTFRPGGHGALINNLDEIEADIIFIKNIDNVVPDRLKQTTIKYKKALAGILIEYQEKIFDFLIQIHSLNGVSNNLLEEIGQFNQNELCILPSENIEPRVRSMVIGYLFYKLNRPLRVCGMVKNEGEPGGGPFWATSQDGTVSLQIVESSQIDHNDPEKAEITANSTHFNPVDIVCSPKTFLENKFDLTRFVDSETGFISKKSKEGKELKALELPGLWNGAMSDWNTIFVEVPIQTFNPVKTVFDLLRNEHQNKQ